MKLAKLPVRSPVKLDVTFAPDDHAHLVRYTELYTRTYGETAAPADLVPFIVRAFLAEDRDFVRVTRGKLTVPRRPDMPPPRNDAPPRSRGRDNNAVEVNRAASDAPSFPGRARLNPPEASQYLLATHGVQISRSTLAKLRCIGGGPHFQRFGRSILYPREELDAWALKRLRAAVPHTSAG